LLLSWEVKNMEAKPEPESPIMAWIGLDWADQEHHICLQAVDSARVETAVVAQRPEALQDWVRQLRARFPQGRIALALEQSRGGLIYALMSYDFLLLYPVPGKTLADYRKAFFGSGAKGDPTDAELLLEVLRCHRHRLHVWAPDDAPTRHLGLLNEQRRKLVEDRTALTNRLSSLLKESFPQALDWVGELSRPAASEFLVQWWSLAAVQQARPSQLRQFYRRHFRLQPQELEQRLADIRQAQPLTSDPAVLEADALIVSVLAAQLLTLLASLDRVQAAIARSFSQHPDRHLWEILPGAGAALAPRLLVALGSDRKRYQNAAELQTFCGIAPVTESSGKSRWVHWRWACPKFLRQTFHEFAAQSVPRSVWARAFYFQQINRGNHHHAAVRALAFKWIRILYRCWQDRTPYNEQLYLQALARRGSPLVAYFQIEERAV
jgi:transposase